MATTSAYAIQPRYSYPEEYLPESDGKPMAETDLHRSLMLALLHALEQYYLDQPMVYVSGNIFVYYRDEAGLLQSISPDVFVVRGVKQKERRIYHVEKEGKGPEVVIELTSTGSKMEDLGNKRYVYAHLGVKEYFIYDPFQEAMRPALRGFRLEGGDYLPMVGTRLYSQVLDLELRVEKGLLRLYDRKTGERLRSPKETEEEFRAAIKKIKAARAKIKRAEAKATEAEAKATEAEARAAHELAQRQIAEAEIARLREELERLRAKQR